MMSFSCGICFEAFSEVNRIPKCLECGHTFCSVCVNNLLQSQKVCPTCKRTITKSREETPTNFYALKQLETKKEKSTCQSLLATCTLKALEKELLLRKEMIVKSIGERTCLKNIIINGITKLNQLLEIDAEILDPTDVEKLIAELETDLEKVDAVLYCCGHSEIRSTYSLTDYMNTSCFLYELVIRLHKGEDIYAYEILQNSKPKYGKITLHKDNINVHALDLSKVDKNASIVSLQDLKECITAENFRTFIEIGTQTLRFSIINSSYLALRFIKLCSGETGPMFKGVNGTTPNEILQQPPNYYNRQHANYTEQPEHIRIEKYMVNSVETKDFKDYDMNMFSAENETQFSNGEIIVQMFPDLDVLCEVKKCLNQSTYKNVVGKMTEANNVKLYGLNPAVITDSGISFIF